MKTWGELYEISSVVSSSPHLLFGALVEDSSIAGRQQGKKILEDIGYSLIHVIWGFNSHREEKQRYPTDSETSTSLVQLGNLCL